MCGRYRLSRRERILAEHIEAIPFHDNFELRLTFDAGVPLRI